MTNEKERTRGGAATGKPENGSVRKKEGGKPRKKHPSRSKKPRPKIVKKQVAKSAHRGAKVSKKKKSRIKSTPDRVRVIPLGGVEEVGRNMIVVEVGDDIIISDVGFEFTGDDAAPGVDYVIPNTRYLEARQEKIKGVFITHGHLDHVGGMPWIMERIGNPPVYTRPLTAMLINKRQAEFPHKPKLDVRLLDEFSRTKVGDTYVDTFPVTHSIPESFGLKIETPQGNIVISGDLKLDHFDGVPTEEEEKRFGILEKQDNLFFIADSTNAERDGFSITEREVQENIADIIRASSDRLIIGTFASQLSRIIKILTVAAECKRKVVLEGRSIVNNVEIAGKTGLVNLPKGLIIDAADAKNFLPNRVLIIATGAQGEEFAALRRMATDRHREIKLGKNDTILFSSSVIPGNERAVQSLRDLLYHSDVKILTYRSSDVHSTGHGNAGELVWINQKVGAKYFMPGYGFRSMTQAHAKAVIAAGFPEQNVLLGENGTVIDFVDGQMKVRQEKVASEMMVVDGSSVGERDMTVMRDRMNLQAAGIVMVFLSVSGKGARVLKPPMVVAKGFIGAEDMEPMSRKVSRMAQNVFEKAKLGRGAERFDKAKESIRNRVTQLLEKETQKEPVVEIVVQEV